MVTTQLQDAEQDPLIAAPEAGADSVVAEPQAAEEAQPEREAAAPAPPVVEEGPSREVLQAQLVALSAEKTRLEQENSTIRGDLRTRQDRQDDLAALRREIRRNSEAQALIMSHLAKPETTDIEKAAADKHAREQQEDAQTVLYQEAQDIWKDLQEEASEAGLDLQTAPEFLRVRQLWGNGAPIGADGTASLRDIGPLRVAYREAKQVRREALHAKSQRTAAEQVEPAAPKPRALPAPRAAGVSGSAITSDNADALWLQGKITDEQYRAAANL